MNFLSELSAFQLLKDKKTLSYDVFFFHLKIKNVVLILMTVVIKIMPEAL